LPDKSLGADIVKVGLSVVGEESDGAMDANNTHCKVYGT
jgi:hypothetical protein